MSDEGSFPDNFADRVTELGDTILSITCVLMVATSIYAYTCAIKQKSSERKYEVLVMLITGISAVAYLVMSTGGGKVNYVNISATQHPVFYIRYIDCLLTTPMMIWVAMDLAGAPFSDILFSAGLDMIMVTLDFLGAMCPTKGKWMFFILSICCLIHIIASLYSYTSEQRFGPGVRRLYNCLAFLLCFLWSLYPIIWMADFGFGVGGVNSRAVMYMVLDILSKCLFGFMVLGSRPALRDRHAGALGYTVVRSQSRGKSTLENNMP